MTPRTVSFCRLTLIVGLTVFLGRMAGADTIQLTAGPEISATVTKYRNAGFEVRAGDGKTTNYPANSVKRIQFDTRTSPAKLTTRNYGAQEGTVSVFENGAFIVSGPNGSRSFPSIFVERAEFVADRGQDIETIGRGQQTDIAKHLAPGNITIIEFYADWCGPCKIILPTLEKLVKSDSEIALRKIDIVSWGSPVAKQHHVDVLPRVDVYDRKGKLVGTVDGVDPAKIERYVAQAKTGS